MLNTDLPDGTWQRDRFDAALLHLNATDAMVGAFVQLVSPTPEQTAMILQQSENTVGVLPDERPEAEQRALVATFRDFYRAVNGRAVVLEHAPEIAREHDEQARADAAAAAVVAKRGPGRPPKPRPEPVAPEITPTDTTTDTVLDGHDAPLRTVIVADDALDALRDDMHAFAAHLATLTSFFDDLQLGDTRVRTWSPQELALLLGVAPATLTEWRKRGFGPRAVQVGRRADSVRYPVFAVVAWLTGAA